MVRRLERVAHDRLRRFRSVRQPRAVAEVDEGFVREGAGDFTKNGQASDSGGEDADRSDARRTLHASLDASGVTAAPPASRLMLYCSIFLYRFERGVSIASAVLETFHPNSRSFAMMKAFSASSLNSWSVESRIAELMMSAGVRKNSAGRFVTSIMSAGTMITSRSIMLRSSRTLPRHCASW